MPKAKVLIFDIENTPNIGYTWEKYEQNVIEFIEESRLLCFGYKWLGEDKVHCLTSKGKSDRALVGKISKIFNKADVLVAHNGDQFDIKKVHARMVYHGMKPPKIHASVDTKKVAKKHFRFNGNGLNDLGQFLKLGTKEANPGFRMWLGCLFGKKDSWADMIRYNKQDVRLLEKVYLRFLPWIDTHPSIAAMQSNVGCNKCGSSRVRRRGVRGTKTRLQQQWECKDCGGYFLTSLRSK